MQITKMIMKSNVEGIWSVAEFEQLVWSSYWCSEQMHCTTTIKVIDLMKKKRSEETQTLRADCSKAEPKIFAPPQTPFPGVRDGQNLTSWSWSLPLPTNPAWWGSMHVNSSYRGNRPTNIQTNKQTQPQTHAQTGQIIIHCTATSAQCNNHVLLIRKSNTQVVLRNTMPLYTVQYSFLSITINWRGRWKKKSTKDKQTLITT